MVLEKLKITCGIVLWINVALGEQISQKICIEIVSVLVSQSHKSWTWN